MRRIIRFALPGSLTLILLSCLLPGCFKDHITKTYTIYRPVYTTVAAVMANINGNPAQAIAKTGKIYTKGAFIFLNDIDKGIHIIDNSDPSHPVQTAFLNIPGNEDIAVKGNTLFADMYEDLLAIDISDPRHVSVTGRVHGVFHASALLGGAVVELRGSVSDNGQVITSWIVKDTTVAASDPGRPIPIVYYGGGPGGLFQSAAVPTASASGSGATGSAGSMAKMVVINNYLYAITESHSLGIVDVTNSSAPAVLDLSQYPGDYSGLDLETIYPFGNELFLGSAEGVYMYDISNPINPEKTGIFTHGRACDPVISDGSYAYVTLHAGTYCGGSSNELDVVPLSNNMQASGAATVYQMTSPKGLSKDGNLLFVCDAGAGVKVYDASKPLSLKLVNSIGRPDGYDVMAGDHHLLLVAAQGLYQYSYDDNGQTGLLSFLPVK